nr:hypothetical protein [Tanacetum cinerariifolium]
MVLRNDGVISKSTKEKVKSLTLKAKVTSKNHFIDDYLKAKMKNTFVGGAWSDSDDGDQIEKDATYLLAIGSQNVSKSLASSITVTFDRHLNGRARRNFCISKNHFIDDYLKAKMKNTFVGGAWSDSDDGDQIEKDATYLLAIGERAKVLLRLIHTDVCILFRTMSRDGTNCIITFTNDFSCYGYIYLIKHKHEVFETLQDFQNKVENQPEKTIKALSSNREDEYTSQEFLDHLTKCGIVSQPTPPHTLQHNGYALEYAARIHNMVPTKKVDKTPYEIFHKKVPNLSYLKVKCCEAPVNLVNTFIPMETEVRGRASELVAGSSQAIITDYAEVESSKRDAEA